jgi:hypothetical protein
MGVWVSKKGWVGYMRSLWEESRVWVWTAEAFWGYVSIVKWRWRGKVYLSNIIKGE